MATGDVFIFEEAMAYMLDGGWEALDDIKVAIIRDTVTPIVGQASPTLATYTEVTTTTEYLAGGTSIGDWGTLISQTSGVLKFDSTTNPSWAQDALGDTGAYWGLIYNDTAANVAIGFVELTGPFNMSTGDLTITWAAGGIFTIA